MKRQTNFLLSLLLVCVSATVSRAEILWSDDLSADSAGLYDTFIYTEGRDGVIFGFDYSSVGIPEAPGSEVGGTTGVKFFANDPFEDTSARATAVQIAPIGLEDVLSNNPDYTLTYDVWMNVNGPLPDGGDGSTEAMMVGVGFSAQAPIEAGIIDGTYFTLTGESGSLTDVRSFTNDGYNMLTEDGEPVNVANVDLDDEYYYGIFPGGIDVSELPVQGGQDNQDGITRPGQMAFEWHQVRVDVRGVDVSFYVDDLLISRDVDATVDGTIFVGLADYFASETDIPEWNFSVVDNLRVFTPNAGDFNGNGVLDAADIDLLSAEILDGNNSPAFDVNGDNAVDEGDRNRWVNELKFTFFGDSNLDGEFNSTDFVKVFQAGQYEDAIVGNSTWETGDWNGDGEFDSGDFVKAFQEGGFETGPRMAANVVPEPTSLLVFFLATIAVVTGARRNR